MAGPTAGNYYIVPAVATDKVLDVSGGSLRDGANIQIYTLNRTDAQVFQLSYRKNGTAQIASRLVGKCVDVADGSLVSGTNVQMYTDNDTRAQQWTITEKSTVTISGTSYKTYELAVQGTSLCMDVYGAATSAGTNVWIYTRNNSNAQRWAFVPVEPFRSGGIYEIRSKLKTTSCADVASGSKANGANVRLYSANHTNAQKWLFTNEGASGWSIRNIASGKYMDVAGGTLKDGTNVQSYQDNDSRAQRWSVTTYGAITVEGKASQIVKLGAANGTAYVLDDSDASTANGTNLQVYQSNGTDAQRWVLWPTWAEDEFMPSPYNLMAVAAVGDTKAGGNTVAWGPSMSFSLVPAWTCAPSYATSGPNGYQIRKRTRLMASATSTWRAWSDWSAWSTAAVKRDGQRHWLTSSYDIQMTEANKLAQLEFQVRATGVGELDLLYGAAASKTVTCYPIPNTSMTAAGWSPDGVRLAVESDYVGETVFTVSSMKQGSRELLTDSLTLGKLDDATTILIGRNSLKSFPDDGSTLTVKYRVGTDMAKTLSGTRTASVTLSYDAGSVDGTPTFSEGQNRCVLVKVPHIGTERLWVETGGAIIECSAKSSDSSGTTFEVPYPFGGEYTLYASGESSNSGSWFTWHGTRTGEDGPVHAWNWDGGYAEAEYIGDGDPRSDKKVRAVYESNVLDSRPFEKVEFAKTRKVSLGATGMLGPITTTTADDFHELAGKHALYRSKAGDYCYVAVTDVSLKVTAYWTEVDVSMIREA